jgi:hypothetical protein
LLASLTFAYQLTQPASNPLAFATGWQHLINKSSNVVGKVMAALIGKALSDRVPPAYHFPASLDERLLAGLSKHATLQEFCSNSFRLSANVRGVSAQARAVDPVRPGFPGLAAHGALGGVGSHTE